MECFSPLREGDAATTSGLKPVRVVYGMFQSPSRRGRRYNSWNQTPWGPRSEFQSPSRRGRRYNELTVLSSTPPQMFQSPSRRGRRYNVGMNRVHEQRNLVSVPFAKGTPLQRLEVSEVVRKYLSFSPLREGDAATTARGTILKHLHRCFSPLREGDAATTTRRGSEAGQNHAFQSPSRRGRRYNRSQSDDPCDSKKVSVPFAKGTPLQLWPSRSTPGRSRRFSPLREGDAATTQAQPNAGHSARPFQSPSRRGRRYNSDSTAAGYLNTNVSVPFAKGTPLQLPFVPLGIPARECFSPLREGDAATTLEVTWLMKKAVLVSVPFAKGTPLQLGG